MLIFSQLREGAVPEMQRLLGAAGAVVDLGAVMHRVTVIPGKER